MDTSKDIVENSVTTDTVITPSGTLTVSGGVTVNGALTTTAPFTMAEGITLQSNDTNNTSTIWMHGSNANHPSILCSNGTTGSDNTGLLSVCAGDFKVNGTKYIFQCVFKLQRHSFSQ